MAIYSQAQNKATQKYIKANLETVSFRVPKGQREVIKGKAAAAGYDSLTKFILDCIEKGT